jgi:hypothetical protein
LPEWVFVCNRILIKKGNVDEIPVRGDNRRVPPGYACAERIRLLEEFVSAVSDYLLLESQLEAEQRGEISPHAQIAVAWLRKEEAKRAAREHRMEHGC